MSTPSNQGEALSAARARAWLERWDRQQERYALARDERFGVVLDIVEAATARTEHPTVVDLGCGPGSLTGRLLDRLPAARVIGADRDPLLLELGRAALDPAPRFVQVEMGAPRWMDALRCEHPIDAAVSVTALHYPPALLLQRIYADLADAMRPGGVLVNADHLPQRGSCATMALLTDLVSRARSSHSDHGEDWTRWWSEVERAPELTRLSEQRRRLPAAVDGENGLTLQDHQELLQGAGFSCSAPVWQLGASVVLVAVR